MILIGLGSNLTTDKYRTSKDVLESALKYLIKKGVVVRRVSSWYRSAPVPISDQPWFTNGVAWIETPLAASELLSTLHEVEAEFGRERSELNASRTLDLDLLAYDDMIVEEDQGLILPHPRMGERAFVLMPLAEVAPDWRHPVNGLSARDMLNQLPDRQAVERIEEGRELRFRG